MVRLKASQVRMFSDGKAKPKSPLEAVEQERLVNYLSIKGFLFCSSLSGIRIGGNKYGYITRLKKQGWRRGFPDIVVIVPSREGDILLFIELKRSDGVPSDVSKEQLQWIESLRKCEGVRACVCFGAYEAIAKIERMI